MTSGPIIMGLDQPARSHRAPDTRRETNIIDLAGRIPLPPVSSVARSRGKDDRASIDLRWRACGPVTPPGCEVSGEGNDLALFSARAALKLAQFSNSVF